VVKIKIPRSRRESNPGTPIVQPITQSLIHFTKYIKKTNEKRKRKAVAVLKPDRV
jgi:hypothetical protein